MRNLEQLPIVKEVSADQPFGAIINETDTNDGTPVVREVYNDHLVNHYKLLSEVGIASNGLEDGETNGYQILEAFKKLPNVLNDIEQVLDLSGTIFSVAFDLTYLPNKYVFVARASSGYVSGPSYTFVGNGSGNEIYSFSSPTGFNASDELLVIIDQSGVRAYSIAGSSVSTPNEVFTVMGLPVSFNDSQKMWYQESGQLLSDVPSVSNLEATIRVDMSDGTVLVNDILIMGGYVLCFCILPVTNTYFFRQFPISDLSASNEVTGTSFANVSDFMPYVYADSGFIYLTNGMNNTSNNYTITKMAYTPNTSALAFVSTIDIENTFVKTSNAVVVSDKLFTLTGGQLNSFNLLSGTKTLLGTYNILIGNLFKFNGSPYFTTGNVAKKWTL